jgi:uncharacterized protein (DUF433 family)
MKFESKPGTLGGELVFEGTRISVHHIGRMFARGVRAEEIMADFPNLSKVDIINAFYHFLEGHA